MRALTDAEKVDCDLRATWTVRERAREQLVQAIIDFLAAEHRMDVLLDRRAETDR